jgi:hypothetical protein
MAEAGNCRCHHQSPRRRQRRRDSTYDADLPTVGHRVGMDRRRNTLRLDQRARHAIGTILPELADVKVDWNIPLAELSRDEMIALLGFAYNLMSKAMHARDLGENLITRKSPDGTAMDAPAPTGDWDDPIPF